MTLAALGVGTCGPDALLFLHEALEALRAESSWRWRAQSRIFRNPASGPMLPHTFWNAAVLLEVRWSPEALMGALLGLERRLGRVRARRYGARTLDLDLLWMEGVSSSSPRATVPHPRVAERAFVLQPLEEVFAAVGRALPLIWRAARAQSALAGRLRVERGAPVSTLARMAQPAHASVLPRGAASCHALTRWGGSAR